MELQSDAHLRIIEAVCPICQHLKPLTACFHCKQPLCTDCIYIHLEEWKSLSLIFCENSAHDFQRYLKKISLINPVVSKNRENVESIKLKIEENFQKFLKKLIKQKEEMFEQIDSIQNENDIFLNFENKILNLNKHLENYQNQLKKNDPEKLTNLFLDFERFKENVDTVPVDYSIIRNQPLKIIAEYEEPNDSETNYFGNLIVTESDPIPQKESKHKKSLIKVNESLVNSESDKIQMFGTLRIRLKRLVEQDDLKKLTKAPSEEHEIPIQPTFIKCNSKNIFIGDQNGNIVVLSLSKTFLIKSNAKLQVENIRDMAVNKNFIALSFADLNQSQIEKLELVYKEFKIKSGVFIFKISDFSLEKIISASKNYNLTCPNGIGMNENNIFVCEKESRSLLKIDLKKASLSNKLMIEGEPTCLDIDEKYLVYMDSLTMEINLLDSEKLTKLRSLKLPQDFFNQLFHLVVKDKTFVAVKNKDDIRCVVYDSKLNIKYSFDYENSNLYGFSNFQLNGNNIFLIGKNEKNKFKLGVFNES